MRVRGRIIPTLTRRPFGLDPKRFNPFTNAVCRGGFCNPTLAASRIHCSHRWWAKMEFAKVIDCG